MPEKRNAQSVLSHLILCGTSGWAMKCTGTKDPWALGAFSFLFGHGALGVLRFGLKNPNNRIVSMFNTSLLTAQSVALPLVNVSVYLNSLMPAETTYCYATSAAMPVIVQLTSSGNNRSVLDLVVLGNIISLVYISVSKDHHWAAGLAAVAAMNHFMLTRGPENVQNSRANLVAIGLGFFSIFGVKCLVE